MLPLNRKKMLRVIGCGLVFVFLLALAVPFAPSLAAVDQPPLKGQLEGNFTLLDEPVPAPNKTMSGEFGEAVSIADYRGQVVLVNFWATWCAPCVREMPSLDRLQAALSDEGFKVMAVSIDRGGIDAVLPFYRRLGLENLAIFLDPKGEYAQEYGLRGLPSTYLVDRQGRLVGGSEGPLEWDAPEVLDLIRYYLADKPKDS